MQSDLIIGGSYDELDEDKLSVCLKIPNSEDCSLFEDSELFGPLKAYVDSLNFNVK